MKTSFLILLNQTFTLGMKFLKKLNTALHLKIKELEKDATVLPASLILPFDKNILSKVKYPKYVIGVTGSSGKGSTTALLAHILEENGIKTVWNKSGSNVVNGTTTLILNNTNIFTHKMKCDCLLLEMDESYIKETFKKSTLTHLILTNITRDQPARNGTPEIILNKIVNAIDEKTHLIINADDPFMNQFTFLHQGEKTTYGIAKSKYSLTKPISNNLDAAYCPLCHTKLKYKHYNYGHLGNYQCPKCAFKRIIDYEAKALDLTKSQMTINGYRVHLNKNVFFAAYYTIAAYTLCKVIDLTEENILKALNINIMQSKRMHSLKLDNREINMLESKNENNLSYYQSLQYINESQGQKTIILGFDNVSRRYKHNDLSWLYDVDFEVLKMQNISRIFCIGRFRFDVAARLINAGISESKLMLVDEIVNIKKLLQENSAGTIFTMVCFDMTEELKKIFMEVMDEN